MFDLFYRNRRLLMLVIALILVTGLSSIMILPRLEDPILKQRAAVIHTAFPGATAVRVESLVTEILENALKEIEELRIIRSASRNGHSTITMELQDQVQDVATIWSRVRDKLNDVTPRLEQSGADAPQFIDLKFSAYAILISLTWDEEAGEGNRAVIQRYTDFLEQKLRTLPGTDDVDVFGAGTYGRTNRDRTCGK
jgi:multidrug efflux pump subunit AcrB